MLANFQLLVCQDMAKSPTAVKINGSVELVKHVRRFVGPEASHSPWP